MTKKFIKQARKTFAELGYTPGEELDYDVMFDCAMNTIHHTEDIEDAREALTYLNYCIDNWDIIEKSFDKEPEKWKEIPSAERTDLEQVPDEDTFGVYYVTNGIHNDNQFFCTRTRILQDEESESEVMAEAEGNALGVAPTVSSSNEEVPIEEDSQEELQELPSEWYNFVSSQDDVFVFTDSEYHIKRSRISRKKMTLYHGDKAVCKLIQRETTKNIYLKGYTPYILYDTKNCMLVFDTGYFNSLDYDEEPDVDMVLACIEYDLTAKDTNKSIARIEVYEDVNLELILLYAAASMLIYERIEDHYDKAMSSYNPNASSQILAIGAATAAMNNMRRMNTARMNTARMHNFRIK